MNQDDWNGWIPEITRMPGMTGITAMTRED